MPDAHAKYSASGFAAARLCPGKPVLEAGRPDRGSKFADEGTAAHWVLEHSLLNGKPATAFIGRLIDVGSEKIEVTLDMAGHVQTVIDAIGQIAGTLDVQTESRSNYSAYLGVAPDQAWGTADVTYLRGDELQVMDLKYGMGVEVDAEENDQLKLYALGKLTEARLLGEDPTSARLVILQPRIKSAPSEWTVSVDELEKWGNSTARSAVATRMNAERLYPVHVLKGSSETRAGWERTFLNPNDKSCKFCKAKAVCPALRDASLKTVVGFSPASPEEFNRVGISTDGVNAGSDGAWLGAILAKADLIDTWLSAVRAEAHAELMSGGEVPGFKLVTGRKGDRKWKDAEEAKTTLGAALGQDAFTEPQLVTPAAAEKLLKKVEGIPLPATTQSEGRPVVAPASDPRPAYTVTPVADEFQPVTAQDTELV